MFVRNAIMATLMVIFFLSYLKAIAEIASKLQPEKQPFLIITVICKHTFLGVILCVLLSLLGIVTFNLSNIFICIFLIILFQSL